MTGRHFHLESAMYMSGWVLGILMLIGSWWDRTLARARVSVARDWPAPGDRWATLTDEVEVVEVATRDARLAVLVSLRKGGAPAGMWWWSMTQFHAAIRGFTLTRRGGAE